MSEIDILVCYHKESKIFENECLKPIHVGKDCTDIKLPMISDNTGDNISYKNFHYAELTAIYWLWKNSDAKIKGLMHYRRLMDLTGKDIDKEYYTYKYNDVKNEAKLLDALGLTERNIRNILNSSDVIVKNKSDLSIWSDYTVKTHYEHFHVAKHIEYATDVIANEFPEFLETWTQVLNGTSSYFNNIFIMKSEDFDKYCEFLFGTLFEVEKNINLYDVNLAPGTLNARWAGFLGERLTGAYIIYLEKMGKRLAQYPAVVLEDERKWNEVSTYEDLKIEEEDIVLGEPNKPILSVCIAVYNAEKFLRKCLDSVINASLKNIEIICINDGSTDNSLEILNEYAKKDSRITVISKPNEGLGSVRNLSIERAHGKYIHFMNSDDYMDKNFLKHMVQNAEENNSDVVISTHKAFDDISGEIIYKSLLMHTLTNKECLNIKKIQDLIFVPPYIGDKIFKLSSIPNIEFYPNSNCEDWLFWVDVLIKSERITVHRGCEYNYRIPSDYMYCKLESIKNIFMDLPKIYELIDSYSLQLLFLMSVFSYIMLHNIKFIRLTLLNDDKLKECYYGTLRKIIERINNISNYEKYLYWCGISTNDYANLKKCKTVKDFDRYYNITNCNKNVLYILFNYIKFKLKRNSKKEKYRQRVYKKIKNIPTSIPLNIIGVRVRINKSLFSGIEKEMSLK